MAVQIEKHAKDFLIVAPGGPRIKSEAVLEALRLKDAYHFAPSLVEAETQK